MSEIKRCENCGNENIEIINRFKGHYSCGKCGRDTERLYEIEHDAEIRAKAIDDVFEFLKNKRDKKHLKVNLDDLEIRIYKEQLKGGAT